MIDIIASHRFDAESTTEEVLSDIDLSGVHVLITGVSAGLGVETARALMARGAHVTGVARDLDKARRATAGIEGWGKFDLIECNLASLSSVRIATDKLRTRGANFDVVIANAGVMALPDRRLTVDGFEMQLGTNHLGHFLLVNRIEDLIRDSGRLVSLSSAGHRYSDVNLDDPNFEHSDYAPFDAYGRSKTANILFAVEFDRRHRGRGVRATAVHPGGIHTELVRHMNAGEINALVETLDASQPEGQKFCWKTIPQGAATSVWAGFIADADAVGGRYCEDCDVAEASFGPGIRKGYQPYAVDARNAMALWAKSEEWVGESF